MNRQRFRLGSVLKHYELQKQRAEFALQHAMLSLREIDEQIEHLHADLAELASYISGNGDSSLSASGWLACNRRAEYLSHSLEQARVRRLRQTDIVAKCHEARKKWAIAEEALLIIRRKIASANRDEEVHAYELQLQETILRLSLPGGDNSSDQISKGN